MNCCLGSLNTKFNSTGELAGLSRRRTHALPCQLIAYPLAAEPRAGLKTLQLTSATATVAAELSSYVLPTNYKQDGLIAAPVWCAHCSSVILNGDIKYLSMYERSVNNQRIHTAYTVSYTHLTLPTICSV